LISDNPLVRARWSWGSPSESVSVAITERACERLHRSKSNLRMLILLVESWRRVQKYSCITIIMNVFILNSKLTVDKSVNKQLTVSVIWLYWIYFNMDDSFNRISIKIWFQNIFQRSVVPTWQPFGKFLLLRAGRDMTFLHMTLTLFTLFSASVRINTAAKRSAVHRTGFANLYYCFCSPRVPLPNWEAILGTQICSQEVIWRVEASGV